MSTPNTYREFLMSSSNVVFLHYFSNGTDTRFPQNVFLVRSITRRSPKRHTLSMEAIPHLQRHTTISTAWTRLSLHTTASARVAKKRWECWDAFGDVTCHISMSVR